MDNEEILEGETVIDDELEASKHWGWRKLVVKVSAVVVLLAFIGFSLGELPTLWKLDFGFLKQEQFLAEDELVQKCKPAVVVIHSSKGQSATVGTGVNISPEGSVITNRHVIEGNQAVEVEFSNGHRFVSRQIETLNHADLAIISFKGKELPFLPLALDEEVKPGQVVTVIGNPRGFSQVSTRGKVGDYYRFKPEGPLVFNIGVTIAPGSSGSPVLDNKGQVVGIVFAIGTVPTGDHGEPCALAIPASALK